MTKSIKIHTTTPAQIPKNQEKSALFVCFLIRRSCGSRARAGILVGAKGLRPHLGDHRSPLHLGSRPNAVDLRDFRLHAPSPRRFKLAPLENGGRGPGKINKTWIPAFAGMTKQKPSPVAGEGRVRASSNITRLNVSPSSMNRNHK
jgi:hypothetical protein